MDKPAPFTLCSACGTKYTSDAWPRHCAACGNTHWRNPLPVSVLLVPMWTGGLLTVRRQTEDDTNGKLGLPGGFIEYGESWQKAAARELWEETGVDIRDEPESGIRLIDVRSATNSNVLIFARTRLILAGELKPFIPNNECSERVIITKPEPMAFPTHTEMVARFFRHSLSAMEAAT